MTKTIHGRSREVRFFQDENGYGVDDTRPNYWTAEAQTPGPGLPRFETSGYSRDKAEYNFAEAARQFGFRGWVEFNRGAQTTRYRVKASGVYPNGIEPKPVQV